MKGTFWSGCILVGGLLTVGCEKKAENPPADSGGADSGQASGTAKSAGTAPANVGNVPAAPTRTVPPSPTSARAAQEKPPLIPDRVPVSPDDPQGGEWHLNDALKGLEGTGVVTATIDTSKGKLKCALWPHKAPLTVANFVGLARGIRPWKDPDTGKWVKRPAYNGSVFHRIIKGFMIQGGDPTGTGRGEPGYVIPDEMHEDSSHDKVGLLCMANRGKNTNGMQFFILDAPSKRLDSYGTYTVFGECKPASVIHKIAGGKVKGDRAVDPAVIKSVTISRAEQ